MERAWWIQAVGCVDSGPGAVVLGSKACDDDDVLVMMLQAADAVVIVEAVAVSSWLSGYCRTDCFGGEKSESVMRARERQRAAGFFCKRGLLTRAVDWPSGRDGDGTPGHLASERCETEKADFGLRRGVSRGMRTWQSSGSSRAGFGNHNRVCGCWA